MKYFVEQKVLSFRRNKYVVKDENKEKLFRVTSNLTIPYKLEMFDKNENKILKIKKRYFRIFPRYDLYENGELKLIIKMKFSFFRKKFKTISKFENLNNLKIVGNIVGYNFKIMKEEKLLANIDKKLISVNDKYSINIEDEKNKNIFAGIVIMIDNVLHKGR